MPDTRVIPVDPDEPDPATIGLAAEILRDGGLVAFATETVYGLGADATNPEAVLRIFEAKGRPSTNPLIVHVADKADALSCVSHWPDRADLLADRFWPGPLTLVLPRSRIIPDLVTAGLESVGVRVPRPLVSRALIQKTGRPIAAPSANRSMGISPTTAGHVLKDLQGKVDLILDAGPATVGLESTVLDLTGARARVLRPGEITRELLAEVLGESVDSLLLRIDPSGPAQSPGQMAIHYAPRTPTFRLERHQARAIESRGNYGLITFGSGPDPPDDSIFNSSTVHFSLSDPAEASRSLYTVLHHCDDLQFDFILIVPPPDQPEWQAVRDRVHRATRAWF